MDTEKIIGVFTAELNDGYQAAVWNGVVSKSQELGFGLICFLGSRLNSPLLPERTANIAYTLANEKNIDGLIIISSAITTYLEAGQISELLTNFKSIPKVSVGMKIPDSSSVTVNSTSGLESIVKHLIIKHHCQSFALISGPSGHPEADSRKAVVLKTLKKHNHPMNSKLCFEGTFEEKSGKDGIRTLLDSGIHFDALICLNDKMALGALDEMKNFNRIVPEDLALVGFDGTEEAYYSYPPLTTVNQPLFQLGTRAVEQLAHLFSGSLVSDTELTCSPIISESCGCRHSVMPDPGDLSLYIASLSPEDTKIYNELKKSLLETENDQFISLLVSKAVQNLQASGKRNTMFRMMLFSLQQDIFRLNDLSPSIIKNVMEQITLGLSYISDSSSRALSARRHIDLERYANSRLIAASLAEAFDIDVILSKLGEGLKQLGFSEAFLILFEQNESNREYSKVISLIEEPNKERDYLSLRFQTEKLLPTSILSNWKQCRWVLVPTVYQEEALGYLLLPAKIADPSLYDVLGKQVASSIKGAALLDKVRTHEHILEDEVEKRTMDLKLTNKKLSLEVQKRIRLEQEVSDISNETMNRIGQDLHDDLCQHLAGISMMTTALLNSLPEGTAEQERFRTINGLIINSIERAKGIARGLVPVGLQEQGLVRAIEVLINSATRQGGPDILLEVEDEPVFADSDQELQLYRIIQEALSNAVKHADCSEIIIRFSIMLFPGDYNQSRYLVEVIDNGRSLWKSDAKTGMGLKIMNYRAEKANIQLRVRRSDQGTTISCIYKRRPK